MATALTFTNGETKQCNIIINYYNVNWISDVSTFEDSYTLLFTAMNQPPLTFCQAVSFAETTLIGFNVTSHSPFPLGIDFERPSPSSSGCQDWLGFPGQRSIFGAADGTARTLAACQKICFDIPTCVAIEFDTNTSLPEQCWIHTNAGDLTDVYLAPATRTQYRLSRVCIASSSQSPADPQNQPPDELKMTLRSNCGLPRDLSKCDMNIKKMCLVNRSSNGDEEYEYVHYKSCELSTRNPTSRASTVTATLGPSKSFAAYSGCSTSWEAIPGANMLNGRQDGNYTTVETCKDYCVNLQSCVAIDFQTYADRFFGCWVHTNVKDLVELYSAAPTTTNYIVIRTCSPPTTESPGSVSTTTVLQPIWKPQSTPSRQQELWITSSSNHEPYNWSLTLGLGVGLGLGGLLWFVVMIMVIFWRCRVRKQQNSDEESKKDKPQHLPVIPPSSIFSTGLSKTPDLKIINNHAANPSSPYLVPSNRETPYASIDDYRISNAPAPSSEENTIYCLPTYDKIFPKDLKRHQYEHLKSPTAMPEVKNGNYEVLKKNCQPVSGPPLIVDNDLYGAP
jgi:hypothetical protein